MAANMSAFSITFDCPRIELKKQKNPAGFLVELATKRKTTVDVVKWFG